MKKHNYFFLGHRIRYNKHAKKGGMDMIMSEIKNYYSLEFSFELKEAEISDQIHIIKSINNKKKIIKKFKYFSNNFYFRRLQELYISLKFLPTYLSDNNFIIFNNAFCGFLIFLLKNFFNVSKKINKSYFHVTDYVTSRSSLIKNFFSKNFYSLTIRSVDFIGVISKSAINQICIDFNVYKKKLFLIDNTIIKNSMLKNKNINKKKSFLVTVGSFSEKYNNNLLIKLFKDINKIDKNFEVTVLGYFYDKKLKLEFIEQLKLNGIFKLFKFINFIAYDEYIKLLNKVDFGISLYKFDLDSDYNWVKYCDPLKVREFMFFGIPIITLPQNDISTTLILEKLAINLDKKFIENYRKFSKNSNYRQISKKIIDLNYQNQLIKRKNLEFIFK